MLNVNSQTLSGKRFAVNISGSLALPESNARASLATTLRYWQNWDRSHQRHCGAQLVASCFDENEIKIQCAQPFGVAQYTLEGLDPANPTLRKAARLVRMLEKTSPLETQLLTSGDLQTETPVNEHYEALAQAYEHYWSRAQALYGSASQTHKPAGLATVLWGWAMKDFQYCMRILRLFDKFDFTEDPPTSLREQSINACELYAVSSFNFASAQGDYAIGLKALSKAAQALRSYSEIYQIDALPHLRRLEALEERLRSRDLAGRRFNDTHLVFSPAPSKIPAEWVLRTDKGNEATDLDRVIGDWPFVPPGQKGEHVRRILQADNSYHLLIRTQFGAIELHEEFYGMGVRNPEPQRRFFENAGEDTREQNSSIVQSSKRMPPRDFVLRLCQRESASQDSSLDYRLNDDWCRELSDSLRFFKLRTSALLELTQTALSERREDDTLSLAAKVDSDLATARQTIDELLSRGLSQTSRQQAQHDLVHFIEVGTHSTALRLMAHKDYVGVLKSIRFAHRQLFEVPIQSEEVGATVAAGHGFLRELRQEMLEQMPASALPRRIISTARELEVELLCENYEEAALKHRRLLDLKAAFRGTVSSVLH